MNGPYKYKVHSDIDEHKSAVIAYYKAGETLKQVAKRYGCCDETVRRRLTEWGVRLRTKAEMPGIRAHLNRYRTKAIEARRKIVLAGSANGRWKGGNSTHYFKQLILSRDGRVCQRCGYSVHPEIIEVHHKDMNHNNNVLENGVSLCPNCHRILHFAAKTFHTKWRERKYV